MIKRGAKDKNTIFFFILNCLMMAMRTQLRNFKKNKSASVYLILKCPLSLLNHIPDNTYKLQVWECGFTNSVFSIIYNDCNNSVSCHFMKKS